MVAAEVPIGRQGKATSLGVYPDVSLKEARDRCEASRRLLVNGIDPSENRKAMKLARAHSASNSFEVVATEWFARYSPTWATSHADRIIRCLQPDIFPWIGRLPIAEVGAPELLAAVRRIENRGALETAHRVLRDCGQVFWGGDGAGDARSEHRDPSSDLRGALPPARGEHFAATTEPKRVAELLQAMDGYERTLTVRCALRLAPLVFVRPGELRKAEWADIDLEVAEWRYIVTKTNTQHIVPLSTQALEILRELHPLTGNGRFVFPSARSNQRPMSDNAVLAAMRRMGIAKDEMSGRGFRAVARTILDEVLGVRPDYIEHQLAHAVRDPNGRAYNRTAHLPERRKMMQQWADYLDTVKAGAELITLRVTAVVS
jgi:integrase